MDLGLTWSAPKCFTAYQCPQTTNNLSYTDTNAAVAYQAGVWSVAWTTTNPTCCGGDKGSNKELVYSNSLDDGLTWSSAKLLMQFEAPGSDEGPMLTPLGGGKMVATFSTTRPKYATLSGLGPELDVVTAVSTDNGRTWSVGGHMSIVDDTYDPAIGAPTDQNRGTAHVVLAGVPTTVAIIQTEEGKQAPFSKSLFSSRYWT